MCQRQRVQVTAYYHLQQLGHASRQGSVKLQQILWFLRASPEEHGMPVQRLRSRPVTDEPQTENAHGSPEETMET